MGLAFANGGNGRVRTADILLVRQALSRLSYASTQRIAALRWMYDYFTGTFRACAPEASGVPSGTRTLDYPVMSREL